MMSIKFYVVLLVALSPMVSAGQRGTEFCAGWEDGYKQGWCYDQPGGCVAPVVPVCPVPNVGESTYQQGYNRGFAVARDGKSSGAGQGSGTRGSWTDATGREMSIPAASPLVLTRPNSYDNSYSSGPTPEEIEARRLLRKQRAAEEQARQLERREELARSKIVTYNLQLPNGDHYEGKMREGKYHGYGIYRFANGTVYKGQFVHGSMEGDGQLDLPYGLVYRGSFKAGEREGHGELVFPDGTKYTGHFRQSMQHGRGTMVFRDGSRIEGQYAYGKPQGKATKIGVDGRKVKGRYIEGHFIEGQP